MGDWTRSSISTEPIGATVHPAHPAAGTNFLAPTVGGSYASAVVAPAANRALFIPFVVDNTLTAQQMFWENGAVAGTTDVGIYGLTGARLVSSGPQTNAGTAQVVDISDTSLTPGLYYMAWLPSTNTTQTYAAATTNINIVPARATGMQQMAVGAATLPNPAVFAVVASAYIPLVGVAFRAVI